MEYRTLELNVVSANDIKNVNLLSKMDVFAVVSISGDSQNLQKMKSPLHKDGGTNPSWNFEVKFTVNESLAHQSRLFLEIKLFSQRSIAGDTLIGTVDIPVKELIDNPGDGSFRHVSYQLRTKSGKPKGFLNLSYKFGDKITASMKSTPAPVGYPAPAASYPPPRESSKQEPVMAYPAVVGTWGSSTAPPTTPPYAVPYAPRPQQSGFRYPPSQQSGYGYPPPQQPGYGYPPQFGYGYPQSQQPGYGYPPAQQQGKKKNKLGMGLGAGLLGGALGGLLIGDMVSDVANYDAGYDAGFDDAGGFDF